MVGAFILFGILMFIGAILGWVAFFKVDGLNNKIEQLQRELAHLSHTDSNMVTTESGSTEEFDHQHDEVNVSEWKAADITVDNKAEKEETYQEVKYEPNAIDALFESLRKDWMVWLGGACVGLSGIFLVKYSIEQGLLGPTARISLAVITGIVFHVIAESLRRKTAEYHPSFSALAGGASIILYAALLAALHLYELINPTLTFALLAVVSIVTMLLALLHGPVLAIIGILGAYVVPILVSSGSGAIDIAMIYSLIITVAALLLMRYVYRSWLWFGMLVGVLGWWGISLDYDKVDGLRGLYLAVFAYMVCAVPMLDWLLSKGVDSKEEKSIENKPVFIALFLTIVAYGVSIIVDGFMSEAVFNWAPLVFILFLAARYREGLSKLPWLSLAAHSAAWLIVGLNNSQEKSNIFNIAQSQETNFLYFAATMSVIYSVLAFINYRLSQFKHLYSSLIVLAPVCWLGLTYLLVSSISTSFTWAISCAALGAVYLAVSAGRLKMKADDVISVWLILGGHFAYSLAVAIYFSEAGLTLALSAQILTLAWIIKRFNMSSISWLLKLIVAIVVCRLTFNPWLPEYQGDVHWTLWTYGGATIFAFLAARQLHEYPKLKQWAEAATLHLLVLTLWTETRYQLYDGQVFVEQYGFIETAINCTLWSALALVYHWRGQISEYLKPFYKFVSGLLLVGSLFNYFLLLTLKNPLWAYQPISQTAIWNILLLAYGMPVIMGILVSRFYQIDYRKFALGLTGFAMFVFVSLEIRHLWQQGYLHLDRVTSNAELYTYSIVWLVMAAIAIFVGGVRYGKQVYKAGMVLLALVIGKIFLIDMSDLTGLLRVASFMGLGLSLLALAFIHQRFDFDKLIKK